MAEYAATVSRFRPYTDAELKAIATELSSAYGAAERSLLEIMAQGNITSWREAFSAQQVQQIQTISADLTQTSNNWLNQRTPELYRRGMWVTDGKLDPGGLSKAANPGVWQPMDLGMTRMHTEAIGILSENAALSLGEANSYCAQRLQDMIARAQRIARVAQVPQATAMLGQMQIRDASLRTMQQAFSQGQTVKEAERRFLAELNSRGITSFVDKAGREWNMQSYSEMVARTVSQEAQRHGTQNRCIERGVDLVEVTDHHRECPLCRPWEGRILSLQGLTEGYPTVTDATEAGLFHPNCAHAVVPHIPD